VTYPSQAYLADGTALDIILNISSVAIQRKNPSTVESPVVFTVFRNGGYSVWMGNTMMTNDVGASVTVNACEVKVDISFKKAGTNEIVTAVNIPFLLSDIDIFPNHETVGVTNSLAWEYLSSPTNINASTSGGMRYYTPATDYSDPSSPVYGSGDDEGANAVAFITNPVDSFSLSHSTTWTSANSGNGASYEIFPLTLIRAFDLAKIQITKTSDNPSITNGNACYSLANAVYGVYDTYAHAQTGGTTGRITTITTNSSGVGVVSDIEYGTYYIKEITPPEGFTLNNTIITAVINDSTIDSKFTYKIATTDRPGVDPNLYKVQKFDEETGGIYDNAELAQMGASLSGAEFTIRYYDGQYASVALAEASGAPTKTWVIVTGNNGIAQLRASYLTPGSDSLYYNDLGDVQLPIGTYISQETKAPAGYLLPSPNTPNLQHIISSGPTAVPGA
jgi:hypothetical protein